MKIHSHVAFAQLIVHGVIGNAIPFFDALPSASEERSLHSRQGTLPLKPVDCNGFSVDPTSISQALNQAVKSLENNLPTGQYTLQHCFLQRSMAVLLKTQDCDFEMYRKERLPTSFQQQGGIRFRRLPFWQWSAFRTSGP